MDQSVSHFARLCTASGALFLAFAKLEGAISAGLRLHLSLALDKDQKFDALDYSSGAFGSMRYGVSRDIMRKIMASVGESKKTLALYDEYHQHIGHISTLRNKLAHQSLVEDPRHPESWLISDLLTTRVMSARNEYQIYTQDVMRAAEDLETALLLNKRFLRHRALKLGPPDELPAWKYKPSSLRHVNRKKDGSLPTLKPPLRS